MLFIRVRSFRLMSEKYKSELEKLDQTFRECSKLDVSDLARFLKTVSEKPLVAIGSGGSYTAAEYLATIHESKTGNVSDARTPLKFLTSQFNSDICLVLISASGRNKDIIRSLSRARSMDIDNILVVTNNADSSLANEARELGRSLVFDIDLSVRKDGYLATNTLVGTLLAIQRGYSEAFGLGSENSVSLEEYVHPGKTNEEYLNELQARSEKLHNCRTLLILSGGWSEVGAVDIESRMAESGTKDTQLTDIRNFAHGRHQWIVQHTDDTGIISFIDPEISPIASKTLKRVPNNIPTVDLSTQHRGPEAGIAQVVNSLYFLYLLRSSKEMDPGNPYVPDWARKIHHLTPTLDRGPSNKTINRHSTSAQSSHQINLITRLSHSEIHGLVLDYDGTLVETHDRFYPPKSKIENNLNKLLEEGMNIGVATGRGKSARKDLRQVIDEEYWPQILIGYYNGTDIDFLTEEDAPDGSPKTDNEGLLSLVNILNKDGLDMFTIETRPNQVSIENLPTNMNSEDAWFVIQNIIQKHDLPIKAYTSGHSVNAIPSDASKVSVVERIADLADTTPDNILRIGDKGAWPGNDHQMISHRMGISVDESAVIGPGGYRITSPGYRGPGATIRLLDSLQPVSGGWRMNIESISDDSV